MELDANAPQPLSGTHMSNSQDWLGDSYSQHPSFQFDQRELALDPAQFNAFIESYGLVRAVGPRLTPGQFLSCEQQCRTSLMKDGIIVFITHDNAIADLADEVMTVVHNAGEQPDPA